jgi:hypothetical protein
MKSNKSLSSLIKAGLVSLVIVMTLGCGSSNPEPIVAPEKPLSAAQEQLLKQIEALPQEKRKEFITARISDVQKFSIENKTFGDRMNAAMGISPSGK